MNNAIIRRAIKISGPVAALCLGLGGSVQAQQADMSFFVTSVGVGKGADLGGLAGADAHCQSLAQAVGAGGKTWRAYLSTQAVNGATAVNAKDRIGRGPWKNSKGVVIAENVDDLHAEPNKLTKESSLNEKSEVPRNRDNRPNEHDALTGTQANGTAFGPGEDRTCRNWTSSTQGSAMLGHIDRQGLQDTVQQRSWNSAHPSRGSEGGCSQADLRGSGGAGLFYCFAAN